MASALDENTTVSTPRRIVIVGNAGGGKSTLARNLAALLDIPYRGLDEIQWGPGWTLLSDDAIAATHDSWLAEDAWIIDGYGPWDPMIDRFGKADMILHVDHPFWRHVWWVTKRQVRAYIGPSPPTPPGCDFRGVYWSMIWMMWRLHLERDQIAKTIAREAARGCRVQTLRSARQINDFLARIQENRPWPSQQF